MTAIPVKTLTAEENERSLTRAFGSIFAKEAMKAERAAGVVRPK